MAGRLTNSRRKKDEKSGNGPQLRQTKLVLRVTAKRLTYTAKDTNLLKFGEQTSIVQNVNLSETVCIKCPEVSSTQKVDAVTSNKDIPSTLTQCKDTISPDKLISRPRRNVFQKKTEACGLSWKEETELKKALYASLQRKKVKCDSSNNSNVGVSRSDANMSDYSDAKSTPCGLNQETLEMLSPQASRLDGKKLSDARVMHFNRSRSSGLYRAQRKFACGSKPGGGSLSSRRRFLKKVNCSLRDNLQNVPYTEDFIDYLCLRGTSFMPESLKIFDKILCTNVKSHAETPSTCSSSDLPRVRSCVGKVYGHNVRKCDRTETRKSGLKNKEFTNAEKFSKVDCEGLPPIEKHRPLTRSFTKTEVPNGKDSGQMLCTGAFPSDPSELYLEHNNNIIRSYFRKQRRKAFRKRVTEEYSSRPSEISENAEDTFQKDTGETQIQEPVSTINLRSGKVISVEDQGKFHPKTTLEKCVASDSPSPPEHRRTRVFAGNGDVNKSMSKKKLLKKFQSFARHKGVRNKRKKRRLSVELIDKSWIRSGLKRCNELSADGKPNRPTTRSRTLASMEDELTRAKMEFDDDDEEEDDDL